MKSILITGIHGFVGSNLVNALKERYTIYGLDIVCPIKEGVKKTFSWTDVEVGELPEVDTVIHLAGKAHDVKKLLDAQDYFDINTGLTQKIFDFFLKSQIRKFIFFSSVKAAADFVVGDVLTEEVIPAPVGPYGESKIAAEDYILSKKTQWTGSKEVYILRPCMIHGPGNKGNLNLLYSVVKKGVPWPLGSFDNRRSFCSIDNLCMVLGELISRPIPSGIYHIADDEALSTNELIRVICEGMNRKAHIWKIPKKGIYALTWLGTLFHLPLNSERLKKLTENYVVSNHKIKCALNISQMPVTAKEGIIKTVQSFLSR